MRAILLAAGVGERLRPLTDEAPKCLIPVGARSLLARHLDHFARLPEIDGVGVVTGYRGEQVTAAVAAWRDETGETLPIELVTNPRFRAGSILSLAAAGPWLRASDCVVMDADVLYGAALLGRLVRSRYANCFLLDDAAVRTGEEMMVCANKRRVLHLARASEPSTWSGWDQLGEGVGFFRLAASDAPVLLRELDALLAAGADEVEYEVALNAFLPHVVAGFEHVHDLPWTEIDFPGDLKRATRDILPLLERRPAPPTR
ncbi:MAG: sugar nucleotidyltransferase [Deltaproteobacteria bacterium HGW-Deltaproteobacteria-14]|jgi:choline kinase|nr:MAG: sugar nucleotidyltransferase [Deltaproteobacteria bacterium HGW-Deltaproteobacteria-14]